MVTALFVAERGCYVGLDGVDAWPESRDARTYAGPWPVVAHPPCSRWCQLAHVVQAGYGHKVGDDGGCFASALASVRKWGGVLEHPAESIAWKRFELVRPRFGAWTLIHGERGPWGRDWVTEVWQRAYGHPARKRTWLYCVADSVPSLDWSRPAPVATVSFMVNHGGGDLPRLSKKAASATPLPFRDLLLSIARTSYRKPSGEEAPGTRPRASVDPCQGEGTATPALLVANVGRPLREREATPAPGESALVAPSASPGKAGFWGQPTAPPRIAESKRKGSHAPRAVDSERAQPAAGRPVPLPETAVSDDARSDMPAKAPINLRGASASARDWGAGTQAEPHSWIRDASDPPPSHREPTAGVTEGPHVRTAGVTSGSGLSPAEHGGETPGADPST